MSYKVSMIGNGSWGTALVSVLSQNTEVLWYFRHKEVVDLFNKYHYNPKKFPTTIINNVTATYEIDDIYASDIIFITTPSRYVKDIIDQLDIDKLTDKIIVLGVKGMIDDNYSLSEYLIKIKNIEEDRVYFLAGPCHAEELIEGKDSYITVAGSSKFYKDIEDVLYTSYLHLHNSTNTYYHEICAILKNIYSICTGIFIGAGYNDNFIAELVANEIDEMSKVANMLDNCNISNISIIGDLLVTSYSKHSRNRYFGQLIGQGMTSDQAIHNIQQVADGYYSIRIIHNRLKDHDYHILKFLYNVVIDNKDLKEEISQLILNLQ